METTEISCGFLFVKNGETVPCGQQATHYHEDIPLCPKCTEYAQHIGLKTHPITEEFNRNCEDNAKEAVTA